MVQLILQNLIFKSSVDTGIIVNFNDVAFSIKLFDINTIKTTSNQVRRSHSRAHHFFWSQRNRQGFTLSSIGFSRIGSLIDLPMFPSHKVLTDKKRFSIKNTDAPVE